MFDTLASFASEKSIQNFGSHIVNNKMNIYDSQVYSKEEMLLKAFESYKNLKEMPLNL